MKSVIDEIEAGVSRLAALDFFVSTQRGAEDFSQALTMIQHGLEALPPVTAAGAGIVQFVQ